MSIECTFRNLKSHHFELASGDRRRTGSARRRILLLIHSLATFLRWLMRKSVESRKLRPVYEFNNRNDRRTISLLMLGALAYIDRPLTLRETEVTGILKTPPEYAALMEGRDEFVGKPPSQTPFTSTMLLILKKAGIVAIVRTRCHHHHNLHLNLVFRPGQQIGPYDL